MREGGREGREEREGMEWKGRREGRKAREGEKRYVPFITSEVHSDLTSLVYEVGAMVGHVNSSFQRCTAYLPQFSYPSAKETI